MTCHRAIAVAFLALASLPAAAMELRPLGRIDGLIDLEWSARAGIVIAHAQNGRTGIVFGPDGMLRQVPAPPPVEMPADRIPHSRCGEGRSDIRQACLTGPTARYDHAVLGDELEAEAVEVRRDDGGWTRFRLPDDAVFEDLTPRLADLDGDGRDEVIVVRAGFGTGAALVVLGLDGPDLVQLAESEPIGTGYRWLNPVGAGDFDGDGRQEIAVVRTPHIGGILMIYRREGADLAVLGRFEGYSNHQMGATVLGMSAVLDLDGDGADDIVVPRQDRSRIAAISFAGGAFREIAAVDLPAPVATSMVTVQIDGNGQADIVLGLADGRLVALVR